ncbi:hypothetical protein BCR44DRAFT_1050018 [Catenaria anguillulae PL171]|uniref:Uncharacterized protein n=1 Tax=Catenaria anguillulae PL171 TaxID=765915 RepID=A0A1Y2HSU5_9FUNG|nr:hypothetical protein BCR44DRAFT_1050018 [Catenaria anguillulae PL171]
MHLLKKLVLDNQVSPVEYFAQFGEHLPWSLVKSLANCSPPGTWDPVACASHVVNWILARDRSAPIHAYRRHVEIVMSSLDAAVISDAAKAKAQLMQLSAQKIAAMLVAGALHLSFGIRSDAAQAQVHSRAPLPATRSMLLDVWNKTMSPQQDEARVSHALFLPFHLCNWVHVMVRKAVNKGWTSTQGHGHVPLTVLAQRIHQGDTYLGRALALLIDFEPELVAKYMIWNKGTPLWLWHKFDPALVSAQIPRPSVAIACFKHAGRIGCANDVLAIIHRVPAAWWTCSNQWLCAIKVFVESESRLSLQQRMAEERPDWWVALDSMERH